MVSTDVILRSVRGRRTGLVLWRRRTGGFGYKLCGTRKGIWSSIRPTSMHCGTNAFILLSIPGTRRRRSRRTDVSGSKPENWSGGTRDFRSILLAKFVKLKIPIWPFCSFLCSHSTRRLHYRSCIWEFGVGSDLFETPHRAGEVARDLQVVLIPGLGSVATVSSNPIF